MATMFIIAGMSLTDKEEVKRLRKVLQYYGSHTGTQTICVEIAKEKDTILFYITAPMAANEEQLGMALAEKMKETLRVIGANIGEIAWVEKTQAAPPSDMSDDELWEYEHQNTLDAAVLAADRVVLENSSAEEIMLYTIELAKRFTEKAHMMAQTEVLGRRMLRNGS
jgi:hypothetical protein